jgi:3-hydroxy-9,10-secoandrosta-1,3,5(10)-triene-9,17-dione monooxygenase
MRASRDISRGKRYTAADRPVANDADFGIRIQEVTVDIRSELIGRAHELKPVFAARAEKTEANRAPLDETIADVCDAGFLQILTPKCYGGHELHIDTLVDVARIISSGCPSTGWVTAFYIGHNWFHSVFDKKSQDEVFGDRPYQRTAAQIAPTSKAVRVTGGYEISGQQSWSSGAAHADYVMFTSVLAEDGEEPGMLLCCVPRRDVELIDNWFVAGMQGTGSCDVKVDNVFVPDYHVVRFESFMDGTHPGGSVHGNSMYRMSAAAIVFFEGMSVLAGILRGTVEHFQQMNAVRISTYTGAGVATKPAAQMRLARGLAAASAVDDMTDAITSRVIAKNNNGGLTLKIRMRAAMINQMSSNAVNDIMHGAGGNSFRNSSALQRFFRDSNVLRTHGAVEYESSCEMYGRVALGMDPGTPVL